MCKPVKTVFSDLQPKRNKRASWLELVGGIPKKEEGGSTLTCFFSLDNFVKNQLEQNGGFWIW